MLFINDDHQISNRSIDILYSIIRNIFKRNIELITVCSYPVKVIYELPFSLVLFFVSAKVQSLHFIQHIYKFRIASTEMEPR